MRTQPLILVIDDEEDFLEITSRKLKGKGFETVTVNDGRIAIEKAEELLPDLVLSDIYMVPGMSGWEVGLELRRNPKTRDIGLVFFTTLRDPWVEIPHEAREEIAMKLGDAVFLSKIDDMEILPNRIAEIIKTRTTESQTQ